jgi:hypothetical protein
LRNHEDNANELVYSDPQFDSSQLDSVTEYPKIQLPVPRGHRDWNKVPGVDFLFTDHFAGYLRKEKKEKEIEKKRN